MQISQNRLYHQICAYTYICPTVPLASLSSRVILLDFILILIRIPGAFICVVVHFIGLQQAI